jgi:hypothetical protein
VRGKPLHPIYTLFRTINVPILALILFEAPNQPRFSHYRVGPGDRRAVAGQARENDIWAVDYKETSPRTVIRGEADSDLPSSGRLWIDSSTGASSRPNCGAATPLSGRRSR